MKGLTGLGFIPVVVNDPGCFVLKSPQKTRNIYPKVVLPMNQGDWLPAPLVRKVLSEVSFDIDEFLQSLASKSL